MAKYDLLPVGNSQNKKKTLSYDEALDLLGGAKPQSSGVINRAGDYLLDAGKGIVGAGESIVGLANIATGGRAGKALQDYTGYDPARTKEIISSNYSTDRQKANQEVENAEGFLDTATTMIKNPSTIAGTVIESAPSMIGGGGLARILGKGGVLVNNPVARGAIGEGLVSGGQTAEQIRQENQEGTLTGKQSLASLASGATTGAIGFGGGRLAQRLGILDPQTVLAGGSKLPKGLSKQTFGNVIKGFVSEGALQELPQSATEQMWQNYAQDKPLLEGVPEAAAAGALAGGVMGGGANLISSRGRSQSEAAQQTNTQPEPDLPRLGYEEVPRLGYEGLQQAPDVIYQGTDYEAPQPAQIGYENPNNPNSPNYNPNLSSTYDPVVEGLNRQASNYGMPQPTGTISKALFAGNRLNQSSNTILEGELVNNLPNNSIIDINNEVASNPEPYFYNPDLDNNGNLPSLYAPNSRARQITLEQLRDIVRNTNSNITPNQLMAYTGSNHPQAAKAIREIKQEVEALQKDYGSFTQAAKALKGLADKSSFDIARLDNNRFVIQPAESSILPTGYAVNPTIPQGATRNIVRPNNTANDLHTRVPQETVDAIAENYQGNVSPMQLMTESGSSYSQALTSLRRFTPTAQENVQPIDNTPPIIDESVQSPVNQDAVTEPVTEQATIDPAIPDQITQPAVENIQVEQTPIQGQPQAIDEQQAPEQISSETKQAGKESSVSRTAKKTQENKPKTKKVNEKTTQQKDSDGKKNQPKKQVESNSDNKNNVSSEQSKKNDLNDFIGKHEIDQKVADSKKATKALADLKEGITGWFREYTFKDNTKDTLPRNIVEVAETANLTDSQVKELVEKFNQLRYSSIEAEIEEGNTTAYSRGSQRENRLYAVHSLSPDNLIFSDDLGGIAVPSIAIGREGLDSGIDGFGKITLIGNQSLIDPEYTPVFSGDAYTTRFPEPVYGRVYAKDARELYSTLYDEAAKLNDSVIAQVDQAVSYKNYADAERILLRSEAAKSIFLKEHGVEVPVQYSKPNWRYELTTKQVQSLANDVVSIRESNYKDDDVGKLQDKVISFVEKNNPRGKETLIDKLESANLQSFFRDIASDIDKLNTLVDGKESNAIDTNLKLNDAISKKKLEPEFKDWVSKKLRKVFGEPLLELRGKKVPYTLDNIVSKMTSSKLSGTEDTLFFSAGKAKSATLERIKSMRKMRELAQENIKDRAEADQLIKQADTKQSDYRENLVKYYYQPTKVFDALDDSMKALSEMAVSGRYNEAAIDSYLKRNNFDIDKIKVEEKNLEKFYQMIKEAAQSLITAPVSYFEAKPKRAVSLNEFAGAVIPSNTSNKVIDILNKNNIPFVKYKDKKDRSQITNKFIERLSNQGKDTLFRREDNLYPEQQKAGIESTKLASEITKAFEKFNNAPTVNIVQSLFDLPQDLLTRVRNDGAFDLEGAYHNGQVYLVANNIGSVKHGLFIAEHEILGHYGLRGLFGNRLNPLLNSIYNSNQWVKQQADRLIEQFGYSKEIATEEILSDLAATRQLQNMSFWDKIVAAFRNFSRKLGLPASWTNNDIANLLANTRSFVRDSNNLSDGDSTQYSRTSQRIEQGLDWLNKKLDKSQKISDRVTPEQRKIMQEKFAMFQPKSIKEKVNEVSQNLGQKFVQGVFDSFAPLKNLSETAYMQAHLSKGTEGAVEALLRFGKPKLTQGALDIDSDGRGLFGILSELNSDGANELNDWLSWMAANRAEILKNQGRENLFTDSDIKELKKLSDGTMPDGRNRAEVYNNVRKQVMSYNKAVLDIAEQSGLIDKANRKTWENGFYLPFYRVADEDSNFSIGSPNKIVGQQAFKKLKGGTNALDDLLVNIVANWSHLLTASMKNQAGVTSLKSAVNMGIADKLDRLRAGEYMNTRTDQFRKGGQNVVWVMENGQQEYYQVNDPLVFDALNMINHKGWNNPLINVMGNFKKYLTVGVTISPTFRVRNLIRDTLQAAAVANIDYNPIANVINGFNATKAGSETMNRLIAGGGAIRFGSMNDGNQGYQLRNLMKELGVKDEQILNTPDKVKRAFSKAWDWYKETGDRGETINRAAIYEKAIADGKSHLQASFEARDLLNFTSAGKWASVRFLSQVLPFFNARLQGIYKLGRAAKSDPKRFALVTGAVALASSLLYLLQKDDDDYKELPDWVRDTYWYVKLGDQALYIPKPFEIGALGSIAERGLEFALAGDDYTASDFASTVTSILADQLAMNPVPQIAKPAIEAAFNYDTFRGAAIDSMGQERLAPRDRYTASTSTGAVLAGKALNISPQRIEHLARGYFGWLGTQVLNVTDIATRPLTDLPSNPNRDLGQINNIFILGDFIKKSEIGAGSKYLSRFYDSQNEINEVYASLNNARKIGEIEYSERLSKDDKLKLKRLYTTTGNKISNISQQIRAVRADKNLSSSEKTQRIDVLQRQRNQLAKMADQRARASGYL